MLGIHALGLGIELPGLEAAQLKHDALDPGVLELDGLRLRVDLLTLLGNLSALLTKLSQHAGGQLGGASGAQTDEVLGLKLVHAEHVCIVQNQHKNVN